MTLAASPLHTSHGIHPLTACFSIQYIYILWSPPTTRDRLQVRLEAGAAFCLAMAAAEEFDVLADFCLLISALLAPPLWVAGLTRLTSSIAASAVSLLLTLVFASLGVPGRTLQQLGVTQNAERGRSWELGQLSG